MRVREILDSETCLETRRGSYIRQYNPYPIRVSGPMSTGFELNKAQPNLANFGINSTFGNFSSIPCLNPVFSIIFIDNPG